VIEFALSLLPTGPATQITSTVIVATALAFMVFGDRDKRLISAALVLSLIGARLSTLLENVAYIAAALTLGGLITDRCITVISRALSILYGIRLMLVGGYLLGAYNWFWLWEFNLWALWLQILIAWRTIGGMGERISRNFAVSGRLSDLRPFLYTWRKITRS
jgi:hypothetical protein